MPVTMQEVRPETLAEAKAFAEGCGAKLDGGTIVTTMSLIATDGDTVVAAALCVAQRGARHRVEVAIKDAVKDADLHRRLVDKSMNKLQSRDVRKFDIRTNGQGETREFWHSVSWLDQTLRDASAPAPGRSAGGAPAAAPSDKAA